MGGWEHEWKVVNGGGRGLKTREMLKGGEKKFTTFQDFFNIFKILKGGEFLKT